MKITDIRLGMLRVPLRTPFKTALRTVESVEDIVVMVHADDGRIGYGEAPPTAVITGDTHESIIHAVRHVIAPLLVGRDTDDLNALSASIQGALPKNTSAKAAVEMAVYDLWAQGFDAPLYKVLGGGVPRLTTDITISVNDVDTMVADSLDALARGYTALKVKVGKDIDSDIQRVIAIADAIDRRATIRLDANQGWTPEASVRALLAIEAAGVALELVEQPVKANDVAGLLYVTERVATPVMADESVFGPREAMEIVRTGAANIINIKLMKTGGIRDALRIADIAAVHGIECMIGCMLESSISVAAAAHVAIARADVITRIDLDGPSLCTYDPVEGGATFDEAVITVSDAPGLGITHVSGLEHL
jgi:o-succinylbenzoate synthase